MQEQEHSDRFLSVIMDEPELFVLVGINVSLCSLSGKALRLVWQLCRPLFLFNLFYGRFLSRIIPCAVTSEIDEGTNPASKSWPV